MRAVATRERVEEVWEELKSLVKEYGPDDILLAMIRHFELSSRIIDVKYKDPRVRRLGTDLYILSEAILAALSDYAERYPDNPNEYRPGEVTSGP